jgi:hypothetical protein
MSKENSTRYEVITQENADGDLIIPIPPPILKSMGWTEDQELSIKIDETTGTIYLSKVEK